jgi:competence protein ComEA
MKLVRRVVARLRESAWAPLAFKFTLAAAGLVLLAAIGSGAFDRLFRIGLFRERVAQAGPVASGASSIGSASATPTPSASSAPSASSSAPSPSASASAAPRADGKIVLATATEAELDKLPGIGPGKAKKIVELRERLGRFKKLEDLYRIKGIKRRLLEKIRPFVVLEPGDP